MIEHLDINQIMFISSIMAISAIPVGFMAGLFGIGGGLITVPVLFYIFNLVGLNQTFIMHLAVGTSFSIIIPTSVISTMTHMKYKAVDFKIVKTFGLFVILGVILGTIFAANLKTASLILFFSIMTMFFALIFLTSKEKINPEQKKINLFFRIILGFSSGFLSAPMGIGGGIINTPILKKSLLSLDNDNFLMKDLRFFNWLKEFSNELFIDNNCFLSFFSEKLYLDI